MKYSRILRENEIKKKWNKELLKIYKTKFSFVSKSAKRKNFFSIDMKVKTNKRMSISKGECINLR